MAAATLGLENKNNAGPAYKRSQSFKRGVLSEQVYPKDT